ncbi:GNAT family N-acetyltransferase [Streptomyces piniterrae]|uniref:GNAT family N-acetyltransferase n=1 Tax=Streptomyces piniterrae TaxID=2571125 RepID=A0A4U0MPW8_9ACTN|nr:GNAT family N-acetyltransferase [Streptomyces piniterrae]TJZ42809.1 GNAT family N-acetyltransferase [Streptomyces piniterrae]
MVSSSLSPSLSPSLRPFRPGDGPSLLAAWRRSVPDDPMTAARFRALILLDANFEPAGLRLAVLDGQVVGAAYAVRRLVPAMGTDLEPDQGWIPFFFVDPAVRRAGLGRRLLTDALDWLRAHGRTRVDFASYTPNYVLPGLDRTAYPQAGRLLDSLGFRTRYEAAAMSLDLAGYRMPDEVRRLTDELTARAYRFGTPCDDDLVDLVRLAGEEFGPDWPRTIRQCLTTGMPLERIVIARDPAGRLAGFAMHGAYEGVGDGIGERADKGTDLGPGEGRTAERPAGGGIERFGPFGVREERRGTGLGRVLLHLTLERMRALGARRAWFLWTSERSPAGHVYRRAGFRTTRVFEVMRWEATESRRETTA